MRDRLTVALVLALLGACDANGSGGPEPRLESVTCAAEYKTTTRAVDGSATVRTEVRAELRTDLDPLELARVTAAGCSWTDTPAPAPECGADQECDPRPRSTCGALPVGIAVDGLAFATCGEEVERRAPDGRVTSSEIHKYLTVTFRIE